MTNFTDLNLNYENLPRFNIWEKAIQFISEKPFFGWGAGSFPTLFELKQGLGWGTYNLFLSFL